MSACLATDGSGVSDVSKYLSSADIFVLPSAIEGFPLSVLEAMAMELAVVASRVGAVPDVIESGVDGFVVSPGSCEEIADTIIKLCNDAKNLTSVKKQARIKVEKKYSNILLRNNYKKLYQKLSR